MSFASLDGADRPGDAELASLYARPFSIARPQQQTIPFVFASPHSGHFYPSTFVARSRLSALALRRSEDAFVDELFGSVVALGAPLVAARFPRAFLDANRAATELDPAMFDGVLPLPVDAPSARVTAGLGVIPRIVRDGAEIYREKLPPREAVERLMRLHRPYHTALEGLVLATLARFGRAFIVDCHSMPSAASAPDVVLGDRHGAAASEPFVRRAEDALAAQRFSVARNAPYAGGFTTQLYGRRRANVEAVQIEINRCLYLDEDRVERLSHYGETKRRIGAALTTLTRTITEGESAALAAE